jgi:hypothetical protein
MRQPLPRRAVHESDEPFTMSTSAELLVRTILFGPDAERVRGAYSKETRHLGDENEQGRKKKGSKNTNGLRSPPSTAPYLAALAAALLPVLRSAEPVECPL